VPASACFSFVKHVRDQLRPILRDRRAQTVALLALFLSIPALAAAADRAPRPAQREADRLLDVRTGQRGAATAATRASQRRLRRRLGRGAVMRVDRATATPRLVADLDGALSRRPGARPATLALDFLRRQREAFALDRSDLEGLEPEHEYRSREGVTYVRLRQRFRGVPALDGATTAAVRDGRLLSLAGAPQPDLEVPSVRPRVGAARALRAALRDVGADRPVRPERSGSRSVRFQGGHRADLVLFGSPGGARLAWSLLVSVDSQRVLRTVVDARSGEVLRRANLVRRADTGKALDYQPGVPSGGTAVPKPFAAYIDSGNNILRGNFAWTYADQNGADDTATTPNPSAGTQIPPSSDSGTAAAKWDYTAVTEPAGTADPGRSCPASGCTWNGPALLAPGSAFTLENNWQLNRNQVATQVHYFVNRFHDHLLGAPISFDAASGNFEGADRVHAQVDDGANIAAGFPDPSHTNNASMFTPPDGSPPIMEMFLFSGRGAHDVNGGDDAQVVLHEYTHGLSNRLVCCDAGGFGQLSSDQSGAMGEAWSDWYMFDYLEGAAFQADTSAPGQLVQGRYENVDFVSEASDCPVGSASTNCPNGGYTYDDFGRISRFGPEVHADGEIWMQTLWDLRTRLIAAHGRPDGITRARRLVTGGMRRSPGEPDFLDMRDAILAADSALQGGADSGLIRDVFAARGMGACAASDGGNDTTPTADFRVNTPAGGCSGTPPTPPTGPQTPAVTPPKLLSDIGFGGFPRRASLRRVLRRGLSGRISCDVSCSFRASLVLPRRSARRAGLRGRTVVVSRTRGAVSTGGASRKVRFKFKRSVARRLRRLTRGTALEVRVGAVDPRGTGRAEKKKLTLKR